MLYLLWLLLFVLQGRRNATAGILAIYRFLLRNFVAYWPSPAEIGGVDTYLGLT